MRVTWFAVSHQRFSQHGWLMIFQCCHGYVWQKLNIKKEEVNWRSTYMRCVRWLICFQSFLFLFFLFIFKYHFLRLFYTNYSFVALTFPFGLLWWSQSFCNPCLFCVNKYTRVCVNVYIQCVQSSFATSNDSVCYVCIRFVITRENRQGAVCSQSAYHWPVTSRVRLESRCEANHCVCECVCGYRISMSSYL